jgi:uncharacterized small protein (DUF1192 family)
MNIQQLLIISREMTSLAERYELLNISVQTKELSLEKIDNELAEKMANTLSNNSEGIKAISELRIRLEILPPEIERDETELKRLRAEFTAKYDSIQPSLHKCRLDIQARFAKSYNLFLKKHGISDENSDQLAHDFPFSVLPGPRCLHRIGWCITAKDLTEAANCLNEFLSCVDSELKQQVNSSIR